jgi:peroxiredoxin
LYNFTIGPFILNGALILALAFGASGWLAMKLYVHRRPEKWSKVILPVAGNAYWIWIILWKLSYGLFYPAALVQQPISIVYYDGGKPGGWLAAFAAAVYVGVQMKKQNIPPKTVLGALAGYFLAGWSVTHGLLLLTGARPIWFHAVAAGSAAVLLLLWLAGTGTPRAPAPDRNRISGDRPYWSKQAWARQGFVLWIAAGLILTAGWMVWRNNGTLWNHAPKAGQDQPMVGIRKGDAAPDFTLSDLHGNPVRLSDFRGKIVLVNFWATWCPPCKAEVPHLQQLYENYGNNVVILGVNSTRTEKGRESVRSFVAEQQISFPVVLDEQGEVERTYQVLGYPTTYLLDSRGVVQHKFQGPIQYDRMEKAVSQID